MLAVSKRHQQCDCMFKLGPWGQGVLVFTSLQGNVGVMLKPENILEPL